VHSWLYILSGIHSENPYPNAHRHTQIHKFERYSYTENDLVQRCSEREPHIHKDIESALLKYLRTVFIEVA